MHLTCKSSNSNQEPELLVRASSRYLETTGRLSPPCRLCDLLFSNSEPVLDSRKQNVNKSSSRARQPQLTGCVGVMHGPPFPPGLLNLFCYSPPGLIKGNNLTTTQILKRLQIYRDSFL